MLLTIELSPEIETKAREQAKKADLTLDSFVNRAIRSHLEDEFHLLKKPILTGAEVSLDAIPLLKGVKRDLTQEIIDLLTAEAELAKTDFQIRVSNHYDSDLQKDIIRIQFTARCSLNGMTDPIEWLEEPVENWMHTLSKEKKKLLEEEFWINLDWKIVGTEKQNDV